MTLPARGVTLIGVTTPEPPQQPVPPGQPAHPPQPPYAAPAPWPVQPAKKKGMPAWAIVLIVLGGLVVVGCLGGAVLIGIGAKSVSDSDKTAMKDVSISSCSADGGQFDIVGPKATISVTNHGSDKASYSISVEFVSQDGGTQLGTGTALVNDLGPGQTAEADASSFAGGKGAGGFKCHITDVRRF